MSNYKVQPPHTVCCQYPLPWLWACCCAPCFAFIHRKEALGDKWPEDYYLCQNMLEDLHPKCVFCPETANSNPCLCLCLESWCFPGGAIGGSRYYLSKKYGLEDTSLEKCFGIFLTVSIFCGMMGAVWATVFDACLGNQQVFEMKDRGDKTEQPITP